ncbi:hypothetical protein A0H76_1515 [Hepatospora eriocheir]|uniref:Uncharacterized protein n=1 Tax=Hepatospora eriocheir TaxID=1081669 RepID=A0A1X0QGY1_9MICR|nr:hypothetical protein A0H76_1515 [Hepatospora eriocheir]
MNYETENKLMMLSNIYNRFVVFKLNFYKKLKVIKQKITKNSDQVPFFPNVGKKRLFKYKKILEKYSKIFLIDF